MMITSNGFAFKNHLNISSSHEFGFENLCFHWGIKANRRSAQTLLPKTQIWMPKTSFSTDYLFAVSKKLSESVLVCEEESEELGNLGFYSNVVNGSSSVRNGELSMYENRVHYLEERDEELLSKRILRLSRSNKVRSALELYRSMMLSGLQPNLHAHNSLVSCLIREEMLDCAIGIFNTMKTNEIANGHTYSLILKAVANAQGFDLAMKMFDDLERDVKQKKNFDAIVYNTMISVCGKVNDEGQTKRIWRLMRENGHVGTIITYRLLVSIFVRCGQNALAIDAYREMVYNGLKLSDDVMHAIIGASTKEGQWDLALRVFKSSLNNGFKPNLIACNALINSVGKAGEVKLAFWVYDQMKSLGHTPDEYTWNSLMGSLYNANRYHDALSLFESVESEKLCKLNLHLYNTSLMCCQKLGLWDKALQILWHMEASGLLVSTSSYNLVIAACEVAKKPKVALQVYEHMVYQKCIPDIFTHLSLIRSCIWGSLWDEVEDILHRNPQNVSLYNAATHGMCLKGKTEAAKKLYMRMRQSGLEPDGKTRALMLQNLPKDSVKRKNPRSSYFRKGSKTSPSRQ